MIADYKRPESVLIVVHTEASQVLLLNRITPEGFWQSVTGSLEWGESVTSAAFRELQEETGLVVHKMMNFSGSKEDNAVAPKPDILIRHASVNCFPIASSWRTRYDPEIEHNFEHVFSLYFRHTPEVVLAKEEHIEYQWFTKSEAIKIAASYTNQQAIMDNVPDLESMC